MNNSRYVYNRKPIKRRRSNRDRYQVDTYVWDGVENYSFTTHSKHARFRDARVEARRSDKFERNMFDHGFFKVATSIFGINRKKYRYKRRK